MGMGGILNVPITNPEAFDSRRGSLGEYKIFWRLLRYVFPYRRLLVLGFVTMVVYTFAVVAAPFLVQLMIDEITGDTPKIDVLYVIVGLYGANAVLHWVTHYIHQVSFQRVAQNGLVDLRDDMFGHLQDQSMTFYDGESMGRIMSRLQNDIHQLQEFLSSVAVTFGDVLILIVIVGVMLFMDWRLGLITMSVAPVIIWIVLIWQTRTWPRFMQVRRTLAVVNGNLQENLTGMRVIQSLNREEKNLEDFVDRYNKDHFESQIDSSRLSAALMPLVEGFSGISMALVVVVGGLMVLDGSLQIGIVVAFALYIQRFFEPIRFITMQYTQMQRALTSSSHIFELMDRPILIREKHDATEMSNIRGEIEFNNVDFHYVEGSPVLKGMNLKIRSGETVAVVGVTGAGKTTVSALILRLYDVTKGSVKIDGVDVREMNRVSLVNQIGTVVQDPFLFSGTFRDNIRFNHPDVTDQQIETVASLVGASNFIDKMGGYDSMVEEKGSNLSAGERQLVALARALVFDPKIIIMDEATASIDSHTESVIQEAIEKIFENRTALVIAHRLSTVRNADRIIVMSAGEIIEEGNHSELLLQEGVYHALYWQNFS